MNYKSLNSAILSVTNPQPKNEALHSLKENIDLYNAVLPYTVGLQSVITLVMIEALLDGSGPISGTVSLFKNLMKKWKARVLGGKLSADQAQSFIAEYEKLSASLPTGKRNFLKASLNKMEQAAKAGDKSKLGAIATEVKDYLARNSAEVKEEQEYIERLEFSLEAIAEELECSVEDLLEDIQTRDRQVQMKRKLKRSDNLVGKANAEVNKRERAEDRAYSNLSADDDFLKVAKTSDRADTARDNRERTDKTHSSLVNLNSRERKSKKLFGKGGKIIKKA